MVDRAKKRTRRSKPAATSGKTTKTVTTKAYGKEEADTETIEVQQFDVEPAYVNVRAGVTKNLGEYESLRVDVSLTVPCYMEQIDEVFDAVADNVCGMLDDEVERYMEEE